MQTIIQLELTMLNNIDLEHIKKTKWYRQGGAGRPGYFYIPFSTAMKVWGRKDTILAMRGLLHHGYFNKDAEYEVATQYIKRQLKDRKYIDGILEKWFSCERNLTKFVRLIDFSRLDTLSDPALCQLYKKFTQLDFKTWEISIHIEVFDPWADKIVADFLTKEKLNLGVEETKKFITPEEPSFAQQEENELYHIAQMPIEQQEKALKRHQKKYFWMNSDWANVIVLDTDYFQKRMAQIHAPVKPQKIKKQRKFSKDVESLFYFFRRMGYWRDERKKAALINNNYYYAFFQEFARRTGVSYDAISFATPAELIQSQCEFSEAFKKNLKARCNKCVYYWNKDASKPVVLVENECDEFMSVLETTFTGQFKELKGTPASRGIITGAVKIINIPADFSKLKPGDILVAPMTRPEYLPLMKIAGGIVTDEGGVTCHAAIVSRELGIPCIIGTQVATEVLKDGDEVEVDANLGVIRKIS